MRNLRYTIGIVAIIVLAFGALGVAQMSGKGNMQKADSSKAGTMMKADNPAGMMKQLNGHMDMMNKNFMQMQKHFNMMMNTDDCATLKKEMKKQQELMNSMHEQMMRHETMSNKMMSMMNNYDTTGGHMMMHGGE
jgi:hypothetical protein